MLADDRNADVANDSTARGRPVLSRIVVDLNELDRERIKRAWKKQDLAAAAGVTTATISDVYSKGWATPRVLQALMAAFEAAPPSELATRLMGEAGEGAA